MSNMYSSISPRSKYQSGILDDKLQIFKKVFHKRQKHKIPHKSLV